MEKRGESRIKERKRKSSAETRLRTRDTYIYRIEAVLLLFFF